MHARRTKLNVLSAFYETKNQKYIQNYWIKRDVIKVRSFYSNAFLTQNLTWKGAMDLTLEKFLFVLDLKVGAIIMGFLGMICKNTWWILFINFSNFTKKFQEFRLLVASLHPFLATEVIIGVTSRLFSTLTAALPRSLLCVYSVHTSSSLWSWFWAHKRLA